MPLLDKKLSMKGVHQFRIPALLFVLLNTFFADLTSAETVSEQALGLSTAQILEQKGYKATRHNVTTSDGYILDLTEAWNPLINEGETEANKDSILFVHGILANAKFFVINSVGAQPRNYGNITAGNMSTQDLMELLKNDSGTNSLVTTAMNFGHKVWLLNRRGTYESLGHTDAENTQPYPSLVQNIVATLFGGILSPLGNEQLFSNEQGDSTNRTNDLARQFSSLPSLFDDLNPRYWNFSFDEQANIDLPETIDYILERIDGSKLVYLGHSEGGALGLMMLSSQPEYSEKLSKVILWAPALYPTSTGDFLAALIGVFLLTPNRGPLIPPAIVPSLQRNVAETCSTQITQFLFCDSLYDLIYGYSGHQMSKLLGGFAPSIDTDSSKSINQIAQAALKGKTYFYDYGSARENTIAYGQSSPPLYDVAKITSRSVSFWAGNTDALVPARTVESIQADMSVPTEYHLIDSPGVYFDHEAFSVHDNASELLVIPTLRSIESS